MARLLTQTYNDIYYEWKKETQPVQDLAKLHQFDEAFEQESAPKVTPEETSVPQKITQLGKEFVNSFSDTGTWKDIPSKIRRGVAALGEGIVTGAIEQTMDASPIMTPLPVWVLQKAGKLPTATEYIEKYVEPKLDKDLGLQGTNLEETLKVIGKFAPAVMGAEATAGKLGIEALEKTAPKLASNVIARYAARTVPDIAATYATTELPKPANERANLAEFAVTWPLMELGAKGAGKILGAAGKGAKGMMEMAVEPKAGDYLDFRNIAAAKAENVVNNLRQMKTASAFGEEPPDITELKLPEPTIQEALQNIELPFRVGRYNPLLAMSREKFRQPVAAQVPTKSIDSPVPSRTVDFAKMPEQYPLPPNPVKAIEILEKLKAENPVLNKEIASLPESPYTAKALAKLSPEEQIKILARQQKEVVQKNLGQKPNVTVMGMPKTSAITPESLAKLSPEEQVKVLARQQKETVKQILAEKEAALKQNINTKLKNISSTSSFLGATKDNISLISDYVQLGAIKIAKGGITFAEWSQQMIKELGESIAEYLPYIWHRSKELALTGKSVLKINGKEYPLSFNLEEVKPSLEQKAPAVAQWVKKQKGAVTQTTVTQSPDGLPDTSKYIVSKAYKPPMETKEAIKQGAARTYEALFDDLYELHLFDEAIEKSSGRKLSADESAYMLALNSREAEGIVKTILERELVDSKGNTIGPSLKTILSPIPVDKIREFEDYCILRNAISWMERGKKVYPEEAGITPEIAKQKIAYYEQTIPGIREVGDNLVKWQQQLGQSWLVDTGILTHDMWTRYLKAHPYYVPFQRLMKDYEVGSKFKGANRAFANQANPTKKAEGSERPIIDPVESIIEQVARYIKTAKRNEVMQVVINNMRKDPEGLAGFGEIVPPKTSAKETVDDILNEEGVEGLVSWLEETFEQAIVKNAKQQHLDRPNVVTGIVNGEKVYVRLEDPWLIEALTNLSPGGQQKAIQMAREVTRRMKILTTGANIFFAARNIFRDLPMSYLTSQTTNNPIQWAWGILDSVARIATNGKYDPGGYYRSYRAMGGGIHSSSVATDRNVLAEATARTMPGYYNASSPIVSAIRGLKDMGRGIERFTSSVETIPRLPEYIRTVKAAGDTYASRVAGLHAAQEVTVNFSRRGRYVPSFDAFVPYLNASMQGLDKIARTYASNPAAAITKSFFAITIPTVTLYLINRDDPAYQQLGSWIKDSYFCIPMGDGTFFKIPKSREAGVLFGSLVERVLKQWADDDPEGFYGFSSAWENNFLPPVRTIVAPLYDIKANKDYADRPIEPGYMQNLSPQLRYDENTSRVSIAASEFLNQTPFDVLKLSPKQIDYLLKGYTGFIGQLAIPATAGDTDLSPGMRVVEVLRRNFVSDPLYSNDILSKFYDKKNKLDETYNNFVVTKGQTEKPNLGQRKIMNTAQNLISKIQREIRNVEKDTSLSPEEKESRKRQLQQKALDVAGRALELTK